MARRWLAAAAAAACAAPGIAQQSAAAPSLSIEDVSAPRLLGALDLAAAPGPIQADGSVSTRADRLYRLDPGHEAATGKRAKLSVAIGNATLFAIAGKLSRKSSRPAPETVAALPARQPAGGKVYGAGIERRLGAFELGAVYQYSKANAEAADTNTPRLSGDKSHNLRATLRVRFRP